MDVVMRFIDMIKRRKEGVIYSEPEMYEIYTSGMMALVKKSEKYYTTLLDTVAEWISEPNYVKIDRWLLELPVKFIVYIMREVKYEPLVRYY